MQSDTLVVAVWLGWLGVFLALLVAAVATLNAKEAPRPAEIAGQRTEAERRAA